MEQSFFGSLLYTTLFDEIPPVYNFFIFRLFRKPLTQQYLSTYLLADRILAFLFRSLDFNTLKFADLAVYKSILFYFCRRCSPPFARITKYIIHVGEKNVFIFHILCIFDLREIATFVLFAWGRGWTKP